MDRDALIKYGLNFFELVACVTGFIYWKKIKHSYWKWFPIYLAIILITELTGKYILVVLHDRKLNANIYRFFGIPIQFLFFFWLFKQNLKPYKEKRWPLYGAAIYIISWVVDFVYISKMKFGFQSFSYTMGNIILLVLLILFFVKFINSDEILEYKSSMMFWVCVGLLIFYLGTFPFYGLRNTLLQNYRGVYDVYWYINFILDYLMYILFAIAFIWGKPK